MRFTYQSNFLSLFTFNLLSNFHRPRDRLQSVALLNLAAELLRHNPKRCERISDEENEEEDAQHQDLPSGVGMARQLVERVTVVRLKDVSAEKEWQQKRQPLEHPTVETFNRDVHIVSLPKCLQSVQNALLITELQVLNQTDVNVEIHELRSEKLPRFALRPNK